MLVPSKYVTPPNIDDLMSWNCNAYSGWGVVTSYHPTPSIAISEPLNGTGSETLDKGEQLIFAREFEGRVGEKHYFEILQKFLHIAHDWKNKVVKEISSAPGATANYFTQSDLPFELSPAFFRPEVLSKYKADSEKYQLHERTISCRGTWSLQSYDINEAGQVHTYLVYLRHLPYEEQLHWKAHNEAPKGTISH